MMNFRRVLSVLCILALLASLFALAGCDDGSSSTDPTDGTSATDPTQGGNTDVTDPPSGGDYTVSLQNIRGEPLANATLFIYSDATLQDLVSYGVTGEDGTATISLEAGSDYRFVISGLPDGYILEESYGFTGKKANITLNTAVIEDPNLNGVQYTLGSVMHDFTFTDSDGVTHSLSETLKEKDFVLLNFWYTTCSYCVEEFPGMESAYQQYKDQMEIFALDPNSGQDDEDAVKLFKSTMGLSFPMAMDVGLFGPFNGQGCPTTVVIDRYGVVCLRAEGAISETTFISMFEHFSADDYTQVIFNDISELTPVVKPNVDMPSSEEMGAALNKGDINVTYAPETEGEDAEMSWPFIIGEKDGESCIYPANIGVDSSFATLYANVELKAGQALAFDYFASCEASMDVLFVLIDRKDIYQISGESRQWNTCYPFVALEDGTYELAFCYLKDDSTSQADDTVYIKDLRIVPQDQIDVATFIPRYCANNMNEDGFGYKDYANVVFNEADGYYHVGSANGPLLLAGLMIPTRFSNATIYSMAVNGEIVVDGVNYYDQLLRYFSMSSNSELYGYCSVNRELAELLKKVTMAVGIEQSENEWLQICSYYDAYGTNGVQLADPIRGLSAESAIPAQMGQDIEVTYNRVIMPRGLLYKFVPTVSGVYRITSNSEFEVNGWVFLAENIAERTEYYVYSADERMYYDPLNCSMVLYMEAGTAYYIDIAFYDVYQTGSFTFRINYEGAEKNHFIMASPGYFTFYENDSNAIECGGIEVILGDDGYYHELRGDGSIGSILYADFSNLTSIFSSSLMEMLETKSFDFRLSESDQYVLNCMSGFKTDDYEAEFKALWGEEYEANMEFYQVEDVINGIYHGEGENMTEIARRYAAMVYGAGSSAELQGCVAVNEELAEVLQQLMDKFTFRNVENSWRKLCYYYDYLGPEG